MDKRQEKLEIQNKAMEKAKNMEAKMLEIDNKLSTENSNHL